MNDPTNRLTVKQRYTWPWIVGAFLILGLILSALAIRSEMQRVREQRQYQMPSSGQ